MGSSDSKLSSFSVEIGIGDPMREQWTTFDALVDPGAFMTSIPASILRELGIEPVDKRNFQIAEGETRQMEIGYARIRLEGKEGIAQFIFNDDGTSPVIGRLTLDGMLLEFDPDTQTFTPKVGLLPSFWPVSEERS